MSTVHRALHVRSADVGDSALIDAWLAQHHVPAHACQDSFDACVFLLRQPHFAPDLVFIGTPDESASRSLRRFVRETWPLALIVARHEAGDLLEAPADPRLIICPTTLALRRLLASDPHVILARVARRPAAAPATPATHVAPAADQQLPRSPSENDRHSSDAPPADWPAAPPAVADPPARTSPLRTILTRDELIALGVIPVD